MESVEKKILITGSEGFVAKNLIIELQNRGYKNLFLCNRRTPEKERNAYMEECDVIVHLAGVNRPKEEKGFAENYTFTKHLLNAPDIDLANKKLIFSSSVQAELDNAYGRSKRQTEELLLEYAAKYGMGVRIYRLPNVFGKWCRPEYNSVVATFCHRIARGDAITINDPSVQMCLVYIDDVIHTWIEDIENPFSVEAVYSTIPEHYLVTVGEIAELIRGFEESRKTLKIPDMSSPVEKKLYSTYLSYLPEKNFKYGLKMNVDDRGSFTEFIRSKTTGQISVNVTKPGIVKGNHWHHTKVEKFLVVSGTASIRFRHMITGEILEYIVSGEKMEVVDIPVGYTHSIKNIGVGNLVTVMWANEPFDSEYPDTFYEEV